VNPPRFFAVYVKARRSRRSSSRAAPARLVLVLVLRVVAASIFVLVVVFVAAQLSPHTISRRTIRQNDKSGKPNIYCRANEMRDVFRTCYSGHALRSRSLIVETRLPL
jgi:hypothetical protein